MISHETLAKATVAGSITLAALALPFFVDLGNEEDFDRQPVQVEQTYEPPKIQSMPAIETHQLESTRVDDGKVFVRLPGGTELNSFNPAIRTPAQRKLEAVKLRAIVHRAEVKESASCGSNP